MSETVTRPEFDSLRQDVKAVEAAQTRLETLIHVQGATLLELKAQGDRREARENQRDGAIKFTVWLANLISSGGLLAFGTALYHLLVH